jgi:hypothetical protein
VPRLKRIEDRIVPVVVTGFTVRSTSNDVGDTVILGNTLETASTVGNRGLTIPISGFTTPPTGAVNAQLDFVRCDGSLGKTGDRLQLNDATLSDVSKYSQTVPCSLFYLTVRSPTVPNKAAPFACHLSNTRPGQCRRTGEGGP